MRTYPILAVIVFGDFFKLGNVYNGGDQHSGFLVTAIAFVVLFVFGRGILQLFAHVAFQWLCVDLY